MVAAAKAESYRNPNVPILIFDQITSQTLEIDFRGSLADVLGRLRAPAPESLETEEVPIRKVGRPKLGVVGREVTLLPRQWEWLAAQPGGASVVLRRLVDEARKDRDFNGLRRDIQASAYRFMSMMAGNRPGFEEAARALFADDRAGLASRIAEWPQDIREHLTFLASGGAVAAQDFGTESVTASEIPGHSGECRAKTRTHCRKC